MHECSYDERATSRSAPFALVDATYAFDDCTQIVDDTLARSSDAEAARREAQRMASASREVTEYFSRYPFVEVRNIFAARDDLASGALSRDVFLDTFVSLARQYHEIVLLTQKLFPDDRAMQAVSLEAVRLVSPQRLGRIEQQWHERYVRRPDAHLVTPIFGRALVLANGLRAYDEVAMYANIVLPDSVLALDHEELLRVAK